MVTVLGHERHGIPPEALDLLAEVVEIPMVGTGAGLDVAVARALVPHKLAGRCEAVPEEPVAGGGDLVEGGAELRGRRTTASALRRRAEPGRSPARPRSPPPFCRLRVMFA
ncbi:hypothetical protein QOM21_06855 [Streptomyces sp. Pv4-95]|uniref:TrmH family RNA methyltransferase n=1 Tax=Streptomyces sp. Pv4-95 TaxID=3049543 RepID=UPI003892AB04